MARHTPDLPSVLDPFTGETRYLGSLPTDPRLVASLPPYRGEVLSESELREFNDFPAEIKVKDQDGIGACNGFACAEVIEQSRYVQGADHVPMSGWYVYGRLVHGRDTGSNILEGYKLISDEGCCPEDMVPYKQFNDRNFTAAAKAAAPRFRLEFGSTYQSWRQIVSAVMLRENMNLSVCVGNRFNDIDREGVPGVDRGPGNHAVTVGLGLKKSAKWGWLVLMRNHWTEAFGQNGFCWLAEAHIEAGTYFECMSGKAVVDDPEDKENLPPVRALANLPRRTTWSPPDLIA